MVPITKKKKKETRILKQNTIMLWQH